MQDGHVRGPRELPRLSFIGIGAGGADDVLLTQPDGFVLESAFVADAFDLWPCVCSQRPLAARLSTAPSSAAGSPPARLLRGDVKKIRVFFKYGWF